MTDVILIITLNVPTAGELAEELGQRLLARQIVREGFQLTSYDSHSSLEFSNSPNELVQKIESETSDWIAKKHSTLRLRKTSGKRQKQNLGLPKEVGVTVVCLEIRK